MTGCGPRVVPVLAALMLAAVASGASESPAGPCDGLGARLVSLRSLEPAEKPAAYAEVASSAERDGCLFVGARARTALVHLDGIADSRLLRAQHHIDRARELLAAWRGTQPRVERPSPAAVDDLEITLESHALNVFFRLGRLDEAAEQLEDLMELHRRATAVEPTKKLKMATLGARVLRLQGRVDEARALLLSAESALDSVHVGHVAQWYHERGWTAVDGGDLDAGRRLIERADALAPDDRSRAQYRLDLADLALRRGRVAEALERIDEVERLAAKTDDLHLAAHLAHVHSLALARAGDDRAARRRSDSALDLLDTARDRWQFLGLDYYSNRADYLDHRLGLAIRSGDPLDVWTVVEERRARLLRHAVAEDGGGLEATAAERAELDERQSRQVAALFRLEQVDPARRSESRRGNRAVIDAGRALFEAEARLVYRTPGRAAPPRLTPAAAAALLAEDTLGLMFVAGGDQLAVLTLEPSGALSLAPRTIELDTVRRAVDTLFEAWLSPTSEDVGRVVARQLSALLFGDLDDRLARFERLAVIAIGPLEGFPIDALPDPSETRYLPLLERYEVWHLPSFSALGALADRTCAPPPVRVLALGDSIYGPSDPRWPAGVASAREEHDDWFLGRLEGSGAELDAIERHLAGRVTTLRGAEANRRQLKDLAPRHRLLHLATHATHGASAAGVQAPLRERSRLALSCLDESGRTVETCDLFLPAIASLDLCQHTVVLSACASADGRQVLGEGTLGLPRAFLEAGAETVIASVWEIDDRATARLMDLFYRRLAEGRPVGDALRQARRRLAAEGAPASAWVPFIVIGEGRSVFAPAR